MNKYKYTNNDNDKDKDNDNDKDKDKAAFFNIMRDELTDDDDEYNDNDWEYAPIPVLNQVEQKKLQERKLMEEADAALAEELFSEGQHNTPLNNPTNTPTINPIKVKGAKDMHTINQKRLKQESERIKQIKAEKKRIREMYGEAAADEYDELYGHIAEKY